jgi:Fur family ferric uptake transcriptional regulator
MNNHTEELNSKIKREFQAIFRQNGLRISEQRDAVVDIFFSTERHLSISDFMKELKDRGVDVSEITVRRIMKLLCEYGIAQELIIDRQEIRYEHIRIGEHHDHLICLRCRKIIEFEDDELERIQERIVGEHGFHLIRHRLEMYGICPECYGDQEAAIALVRAQEGDSFTVIEIGGGMHVRNRLKSLGLVTGAMGRMVKNNGIGQVVIEIRGSRVVLGWGISQKVLVNLN